MKRALSITLLAAAAIPAVAQPTRLHDDFDSYQPGAPISSLAGWELWADPPGLEGFISDEQAFSGGNSLHLNQARADVVHQVFFEDGKVTFRAMTYVPSASQGLEAYLSALSGYDGGGSGTAWGLYVKFDTTAAMVELNFPMTATPLIFDRWIEWRVEVKLDFQTFDLYYGDVLLADDAQWAAQVFHGPDDFAAISFYVHALASAPGMYIDDVLVTRDCLPPPPTCGVCYADCDASGAPDFFDFLCYQNLFAAGDPHADCDGSGGLDFFDFLCFQNEFGAGCG